MRPLFLLYFQLLATPDVLHPILAYVPACFCNLSGPLFPAAKNQCALPHDTPTSLSISVPLSQRNVFGTPCCKPILLSTRTTSAPFRLCPTSIARVSRVSASTTVKARNLRPSASCSATKSRLHTSFDAVGLLRSRRFVTTHLRRRGLWRSVSPSSRRTWAISRIRSRRAVLGSSLLWYRRVDPAIWAVRHAGR